MGWWFRTWNLKALATKPNFFRDIFQSWEDGYAVAFVDEILELLLSFSLIMWDSTFKSDQISIFVGHFSIRGNLILFCEKPQKRFPILRHVHLHSRRNSVGATWRIRSHEHWLSILVFFILFPCLKALLGDGLWVCLFRFPFAKVLHRGGLLGSAVV